MAQPPIQFYHLLSTRLEQALPKLMEMAISKDMKVVILADTSQIDNLDKILWTYQPNSFLAHGTCKNAPNAAEQPIYITDKIENPNEATLLVITNGTTIDDYNGYSRVFDMFDGADNAAVEASRKRWKFYLGANYSLTYIRQNDRGGWDKIKEVNASK